MAKKEKKNGAAAAAPEGGAAVQSSPRKEGEVLLTGNEVVGSGILDLKKNTIHPPLLPRLVANPMQESLDSDVRSNGQADPIIVCAVGAHQYRVIGGMTRFTIRKNGGFPDALVRIVPKPATESEEMAMTMRLNEMRSSGWGGDGLSDYVAALVMASKVLTKKGEEDLTLDQNALIDWTMKRLNVKRWRVVEALQARDNVYSKGWSIHDPRISSSHTLKEFISSQSRLKDYFRVIYARLADSKDKNEHRGPGYEESVAAAEAVMSLAALFPLAPTQNESGKGVNSRDQWRALPLAESIFQVVSRAWHVCADSHGEFSGVVDTVSGEINRIKDARLKRRLLTTDLKSIPADMSATTMKEDEVLTKFRVVVGLFFTMAGVAYKNHSAEHRDEFVEAIIGTSCGQDFRSLLGGGDVEYIVPDGGGACRMTEDLFSRVAETNEVAAGAREASDAAATPESSDEEDAEAFAFYDDESADADDTSAEPSAAAAAAAAESPSAGASPSAAKSAGKTEDSEVSSKLKSYNKDKVSVEVLSVISKGGPNREENLMNEIMEMIALLLPEDKVDLPMWRGEGVRAKLTSSVHGTAPAAVKSTAKGLPLTMASSVVRGLCGVNYESGLRLAAPVDDLRKLLAVPETKKILRDTIAAFGINPSKLQEWRDALAVDMDDVAGGARLMPWGFETSASLSEIPLELARSMMPMLSPYCRLLFMPTVHRGKKKIQSTKGVSISMWKVPGDKSGPWMLVFFSNLSEAKPRGDEAENERTKFADGDGLLLLWQPTVAPPEEVCKAWGGAKRLGGGAAQMAALTPVDFAATALAWQAYQMWSERVVAGRVPAIFIDAYQKPLKQGYADVLANQGEELIGIGADGKVKGDVVPAIRKALASFAKWPTSGGWKEQY